MPQLGVFPEPPAQVPQELSEFLREIGRPALFRLPGATSERARLLVGGLHGNEPSGFAAIHDLLRDPPPLPCDAWLFLGNVPAALADGGFRYRALPGEEDLNRVWERGDDTPLRRLAGEVLAHLADLPLEAVADLHNNTGYNPVYSVVLQRDALRLGVARHWTSLFVRYGGQRLHTLLEVLNRRTPGAVVECGQAGTPEADAAAIQGARSFLTAAEPFLAGEDLREGERVYRSVARVMIPAEVEVDFDDEETEADLTVSPGLDLYNFVELPAETLLARRGARGRLLVQDERGVDVTSEWLEVRGREVRTLRPLVPVMMTTSAAAAKSDCLLYVAEIVERGPGA